MSSINQARLVVVRSLLEIEKGGSAEELLLSGDHKKIKSWKNKNRKARTMINRPDLWSRYINENKSEIRNE